MRRIDHYKLQVESLGLVNVARWKVAQMFARSGEPVEVRSKHLSHPVFYRPGSSDLMVFHQIYIEREYSCLDDLKGVKTILDLGANVGYSSAYFLSKFPEAFVVAVEPDPENLKAAERNLKPYEGRYKLIQAAVWPERTKLYFDATTLGPEAEWGRKVGTANKSNVEVQAVDINSLLDTLPHRRISLLKMDIEGAERQVFARNLEPWLSLTDAFAVELHDKECEEALQAAVHGRGFTLSTSGELTIGRKHS